MYDVIVVGGGHAGCEAALASARLNNKTLLITGNINNIADMPCNPSIGGSAKGIVVREIDALGGEMGSNADKSILQIKLLNKGKGPGVRSLRCQADKTLYPLNMLKTLKTTKNLYLKQEMVKKLIIKDNDIQGILTETDETILSKVVILTTGTYLNSDILRGDKKEKGGPHGEKTSLYLSTQLNEVGLKIIRLKTGTPPRLDIKTMNLKVLKEETGDKEYSTFSNYSKPKYIIKNQIPCYLTYTNLETHKVIKENLDKCSLYSGLIKGVGPRYCPSIEDKVVKFADKERHQIFIEPERLGSNEYYMGGFSTTMPIEIQEKLVHTIEGLENAKILKYGYAIEYDAVDPTELMLSLETKKIKNLFLAGQINGTSGYEEAAAQGLIAGINASRKLQSKKALVLKRDEAYIGVLIDDLINKGITEPYRLLTSRAEFRLLLRHDNADERLSKIGRKIGLLGEKKYSIYLNKMKNMADLEQKLKNSFINYQGKNIRSIELLKRPEISISKILKQLNLKYDKEIKEKVEINIKYSGYISKIKKEVSKLKKLERKKIPQNIDYGSVRNLATEARQKLIKIRPLTIGQASRISGINPSDITMLLIYLKKEYPNE